MKEELELLKPFEEDMQVKCDLCMTGKVVVKRIEELTRERDAALAEVSKLQAAVEYGRQKLADCRLELSRVVSELQETDARVAEHMERERAIEKEFRDWRDGSIRMENDLRGKLRTVEARERKLVEIARAALKHTYLGEENSRLRRVLEAIVSESALSGGKKEG